METLPRSDSRRLYSWWWDSHISPKNSKWLQENLADMDAKIKTMIRLIEEDADSFARRAEMYYKKRPELMKLVEEFYRAYRALAERYDHATAELRHAHRTMAEAFPNQVPFEMAEDSSSGSAADKQEPHTPEMPHPIRSLLDPDDSNKVASGLASSGLRSLKANGSYSGDSDSGFGKKSSKQLNEMVKIKEAREQNLASEVLQLFDENQNLKDRVVSESNRAGRAETEIHNLKKALADMHSEKEAMLLQYQQSMEKLSNLEGEINLAQMNSRGLDEQARKAAIEVQILKEALFKLEAERDAGFLQQKKLLERISNLESTISKAQEDARGLDERGIRAEIQARYLEKDLSRLESEKDAGLEQYKVCLKRISVFERKLSLAQEEVRLLTEKADRAETEVWKLKRALADLNEEKEAAALQYEHCLKKISKLESELLSAEEDIRQLNSAVLVETAKLKSAEEKCDLLETSNQSLQLEADNLVKRIGMKDLELSKKDEELEKLQAFVRDEHLQFALVESTLQTLQNLHFQSQADQRSLVLELQNGLQILKGLEICKHGLEEEIQKVKDENRILDELNSSSTISMENLKGEILSLQKMKEKLEEEVGVQISQTNSLQQEIYHLKEDINSLNKRYQAFVEQVESVGLNPECIGSSAKELMDENTKLRQICKERDEKEVLFKKLDDLEHRLDKNACLEMSLSNLRGELDGSRDKFKALQDSCQLLSGEKSALVAEKAILMSQLQIITDTMQKLLEKNFILENSLSGANIELEGLKAKSNSLEELCKVLNNEKSNLLCERTTLVIQLNNVEQRLQSLEKRFAELEQKHAGLEKEKESTLSQVAELKVSLDAEKQERENFTMSSGPRLASLENYIQSLQEETRSRKKEFEEELDKAVNAQFEIFILRKFIQDMEQKNYSLLIECEKHAEASELTNKLISELEGENLEQQVEAELLLDEIEKLRLGTYKVLRALDIGPEIELDDKIGNDQIFVHHIIENIEDMKCSLWNYEDDRQQLLVENSILLTLVGQLRFEGMEIVSEKKILDQEFEATTKQLAMVQNKEHELLELNGQLKSEVNKGEQQAGALKAEMEKLCAHQGELQRSYFNLQLDYSHVLEENSYLLKNLSDLREKEYMVEEESDFILLEMLALDNLVMIFKNFVTEKTVELELLSEDLHKLHGVNGDIAKEVVVLRGKLEMKETENLLFKDLVNKLEEEVRYVRYFSNQLRQDILTGKDLLCRKETELSVVERNLKSTEDLNSELCRTVEGLKMQHEESVLMKGNLEKHILELSEVNMHQNKEIECLHEVNWNLESQLRIQHEAIEEHRIQEENMSSELQEMSNEFEIWEAEAATFHFDLQISNIREVLFENKVHELTAVCEALSNESCSKTVMVEDMKERVALMEAEIGGLKAQLHAFTPAIDCPRDDTVSLEQNIHSRPEFHVADNQKSKDVELAVHEKSRQVLMEDHNSVIPNRIPELQELQARISAVERVVTEEMKRLAIQESSNIKLENALRQMEELKSNYGFSLRKYEQKEEELGDELSDYPKLKKKNPEIFLVRNGILMKEFPLDHISDSSMHGRSRRGYRRADNQTLELWETSGEDCGFDCTFMGESKDLVSPLQAEKELGVDKLEVSTSCSKPNQDRNKRKILERLGSDAQKLKSLRTTVEDLRRKLETNKNKKKRAKNVDIEIVKEQLKEVEETIVQLVEVNGRLSKHVEESSEFSEGKASPESEAAENVRRKRVTEQARKGSEKLGRLLLEVQRIEYALLKLEDEKKSRGKNRFSRSRTSVILKNFIYSGRRGNPRHKKACLCGCFRPPTDGEGNTAFSSIG